MKEIKSKSKLLILDENEFFQRLELFSAMYLFTAFTILFLAFDKIIFSIISLVSFFMFYFLYYIYEVRNGR